MTTEAPAFASTLGYGLAHRGRSQSVLLRRRPAARLVGAVGRASVGFGLAVGRSRSIRPVVRRADLNSPMLRPPPGFWLNRADDEELDARAAAAPVSEAVPSKNAVANVGLAASAAPVRSKLPATTATTATLPTSAASVTGRPTVQQRVDRMATPAATVAPAKSAPTSWTDQVIDRASVGYVRPTSGTFTPAPKPPDDFVTSGNSKLDDLRLLVAAKAAGSDDGDTPAPRSIAADRTARRVQRTPNGAVPSTAQDVADATSGARGDTLAGARTGPGHLARSVIPESAIAGTALTGKGSSRRSVHSNATMGVPQSPLGREGVPARAKQQRPKTPEDRMDDLREALIAKGLMPAGDDAEAPTGSNQDDSGGNASGRDGSRADDASNGERANERVQRTPDQSPRRSDPGRSESSRQAPSPRSDRTVDATDPRTGRSTPQRSGGASDGSAQASTSDRFNDTSRTARSGLDLGAASSGTGSTAAKPPEAGPSSAGASSSGPSSDGALFGDPALPAIDAASAVGLLERQSTSDAESSVETVQRELVEQLPTALSSSRPIPVDSRSGAVSDVVAESVANGPSFRGSTAAQAPSGDATVQAAAEPFRRSADIAALLVGLPGVPGSAAAVRRRVSLPRAMSFDHRPSGTLTTAADRSGRVVRRAARIGHAQAGWSVRGTAAQSEATQALAQSSVGDHASRSRETLQPQATTSASGEAAARVLEQGSLAPLTTASPATALPTTASPTRRTVDGTPDAAAVGSDTTIASETQRPTASFAGDAATSAGDSLMGETSSAPDEETMSTVARAVQAGPAVDVADLAVAPGGIARMVSERDRSATTRSAARWSASPVSTTESRSGPETGGLPSGTSTGQDAPARSTDAARPALTTSRLTRPRTVMPAGPGALAGALRRHPVQRRASLPAATAGDSSTRDLIAPGRSGEGPVSSAPDDRSASSPTVEVATELNLPTDSPQQNKSQQNSDSSQQAGPLASVRAPLAPTSRVTPDDSTPAPAERGTSRPQAEASSRDRSARTTDVQRTPSRTAGSTRQTATIGTRAATTGIAGAATSSDHPNHPLADNPEVSSVPSPASPSPESSSAASPVNELAQRFMTELSSTIRRRPAPLPVAFQPMADEITGGRGRNVMLSTDNASRRALRSVGKVAATTDNVIHLAAAPTPSSRLNEVIAHELTHIAAPSPVARFFDDADDSPEERQAERVARVMATSPLAPTSPASAPGSDNGTASASQASLIRRSPASTTRPSTGSTSSNMATQGNTGGLSASALAASISGKATASQSPDVQRLNSTPPQAPKSAIGSNQDAGAPQSIGAQLDSGEAKEWFADQLDRNFDRLVNALEDRMIVEFERRGGRLWEGL